jgi:hypothetical protein
MVASGMIDYFQVSLPLLYLQVKRNIAIPHFMLQSIGERA